MKTFAFLISCLFCFQLSTGQNGVFPPVTFPARTNLCDESPWQLVFQDHFNGTTLQAPWLKHICYAGADHDDWGEARCISPYNQILKDENVVVSDGTVKLKMKKEPSSWRCATCSMETRHTDYSGAAITLPYTRFFNTGKFEARIKFPSFKYAHSCFWIWHGSCVNEIDIAEGYGYSVNSLWPFTGGWPYVDCDLHAWKPRTVCPNPYDVGTTTMPLSYPDQSWWDVLWGNNMDISDFHTYTCEWEPNVIRNYIDGNLANEVFRYYTVKSYRKWWNPFRDYYYTVGSGCNPESGELYYTSDGFPWDTASESQLRITTGLNEPSVTHDDGFLGEVEVDYVKVWQQKLDRGWTSLCDPAITSVTGPQVVCSTATYRADPPSPTGYWAVPSSLLTVVSSDHASITVQRNEQAAGQEGFVNYCVLNPDCPEASDTILLQKRVFVGKPDNITVAASETHDQSAGTVWYNLHANTNATAPANPQYNYENANVYEWDIDYGPNFSIHHHVFGKTVSTPVFTYTSGTNWLKWSLKISNSCGSVTKAGQMAYLFPRIVQGNVDGMETDRDPDNIYTISDITDMDSYERAVSERLAHTPIGPEADSIAVSSMIEQIEMEELSPYIVLDSPIVARLNSRRHTAPAPELMREQTRAYPNPTSNFINIDLSSEYRQAELVNIQVLDLFGRIQKQKRVVCQTGDIVNIDVLNLPSGLYSIKLQQGNKMEFLKVYKR